MPFEIRSSSYLACPWINDEAKEDKTRSPGARQLSSDVIAIRVIGNVEENQPEFDDARASYVTSNGQSLYYSNCYYYKKTAR